ncbi:putative Transposable element Tc1 transposase-like 25 [Homarus americanus]|uniref:Putative Transposable element Tc1 transposase-like 25 n=1 Tax=Homarus americanus TaxID=6706 RepID=A0A8J5JT21_HOMAM|nr:putative Transposable element Tc1 transposase-like 25 [Homarus americanus]
MWQRRQCGDVCARRAYIIGFLLTEQHRAARFAFARQYEVEDLAFWSKFVFCDEKIITSTNHDRISNWRPSNTRYDRRNIYEEARSGHVTVNVWW